MSTTTVANTLVNNAATNNSTANTSSKSSGTSSSVAGLNGTFNTFLTLLTTQLKNQDPTSPLDSNQFTQQLVSFSGVEQQTQTNSLLKQLISNSQGSQISSASSFIGSSIKASGNQIALVSGASQFGYNLTGQAATVDVNITNSSGNLVFSGKGTTNVGDNKVAWNGINSITGNQETDGVYKISVVAKDAQGNAVNSTPYITGTVDSASIDNGVIDLNIGKLQVPQSNVIGIFSATKSGSSA
ncbi:MAG: flagellar hook capping FlgD N-terminal domain-containing protein [Pseudomonadota bacterium]